MSTTARLSGSSEYADYLLRAREKFTQGRAATLDQIQKVYRRAAVNIADDINKLTPGTLQQAHLTALQTALDKRAIGMSKEILAVTHQGVWMSSGAGSKGVADTTAHMVKGVFPAVKVEKLFAGINERATLAMLARTRQDKLKLSDRVWRTSENARRNVQRIVEDAVVRGQDARTTARHVQQYLQPGVFKPHKLGIRQRLRIDTDVSYQAMRLARTEMNNAFHEGMIASNQHNPGYLGIFWRLSGAHAIPDVCTDMAADMSHGELGFYPKGKEPVRPHPNCMCVAIPAYENPNQLVERLREWRDKPELHPDLGAWYNHGNTRQILGRPTTPIPTIPVQTKFQTVLRAKEDEIAMLAHERIYVLDKQGNVVFTKDGTVSQISFTRTDLDKIRAVEDELTSTHNHPTLGGSFSLDDINFSVAMNISETRAVGRTYAHLMRRPKAGWPQQQLIENEYNIADSMVKKEFWRKIHTNQMTPKLAQAEHCHTIWTIVAKKLGLDYMREVR